MFRALGCSTPWSKSGIVIDIRPQPVGIITGAASGIGFASAVEFAKELGADLVLGALTDDELWPVAKAVAAHGARCVLVAADVREPSHCERLARTAIERFGRVDFVHVNAGVADQGTVAEGDPDRWRRVLDTNLLGAALTVRAVLPMMLHQASGHVVFTASVSGRETYVGEPMYIASKWGLVGFAHALRLEVEARGVRVTLIEPGLVDTPLTRTAPAVAPVLAASDPLLAEDVARAAVYAFRQPPHVNVSELTIRPLRPPQLDRLSGGTQGSSDASGNPEH